MSGKKVLHAIDALCNSNDFEEDDSNRDSNHNLSDKEAAD